MSTDIKLEDVFAGTIELTATERGYLSRALEDHYMRGGWCPEGVSRLEMAQRVQHKINALKLTLMVTPDGSRLVSVAEHDAIVAKMYPEDPKW